MNEQTLLAALRLAQAIEGDEKTPANPDRRYCVVRADRSGVFCGYVDSENGRTVEMSDVRHIWYWSGASATDELATRGVAKPEDCKFTAPARRIRVLDAITVLDCTPEAEESLRAVKDWSQFK